MTGRSIAARILQVRLYNYPKDFLYIGVTEVECGTSGDINLEHIEKQLNIGPCNVS